MNATPSINMESLAVIFSVVCAISGFGILAMIFFFLSRPRTEDPLEDDPDK